MTRRLRTRREFLGASAAGAAAMALAPALARAQAKKPLNVLWVTCEDTSPDLGCYGDPYAVTPNLDKLAAEGCRYDLAFSHAPVCAPARSGIITGMYPTTIGSHHMRCQAVPQPFVRCFTEYLRAAGYYCTNNSKTDYNFPPPLTAWDECSNKAHWRSRPDKSQPFFAVFNIGATHESQCWPNDGPFQHDPAKANLPPYYPDTPVVRRNWARYYDQVTKMDAQVAGILRQLREDGLAEDTVVFFYGDHGRGLTRGKRWCYDSGLRVPLLIRWPGVIKPGSTSDRLVCFIDFGPTVLSIAGIQPPEHMQGRAFLGPFDTPPRDCVFAARDRMDETYDIIRSVRDKRFRYIRNFEPHKPYAQVIKYMEKMPILQEMRRLHAEGKLSGPPALWFAERKPVEELYDTTKDPHEIDNLAGKPEFQDTLAKMRKQLDDWMKETKDLGLIPEAELREKGIPGGKPDKTADPKIEPAGGKFDKPVTVAITCPTEGASVAYTLDEGPAPHWRLYSRPLTLEKSATVRARACRIGWKDSGEVRAAFEL
ncbi:MAG TPA: sulfatase-like hydrolase/transferase [Planctomycetota bacterium]|nr:sulfatase-like hydrolase/transferase [Planctomycetota bacterium]HRR80275.1 sulfatase-like hydrolase/transferase [Planctomycetota bacterium]HRT93383.1 sulfatase-like hydrolase/transferase [Planctomycetota bacterium]